MSKCQQFLSSFLSVVLVSIVGLLGTVPVWGNPPPPNANATKQTQKHVPIEDVKRFSKAIGHIKKFYVKPTDDKDLFEDAIRGMLAGLDPHSSYLDEDEYKELQQTTRGEFSGIGIEVTMSNGVIKVISPIDDTPAARAGIQAGDLIIQINKVPVKGMTLSDAVKKMRGKQGTPIKIVVLRKNAGKPLYFEIKRDKIRVRSVKSKLLDGQYGYIRISHFQRLSAEGVIKAIRKLKKESNGPLKGVILDLRNNPGGLLTAAINVSDVFIHNDQKGNEEVIVYTKGRIPGSEYSAFAKPGDMLRNAPIVVLINEGSASASEIVAGALKDHKRAILLGTKSFGKGSVQTIIPLDSKRGIKLTTALYYTPAGVSIQAKGITPDIVVKNIKIPKKNNNKMGLNVSEADLSGHLETNSKESGNTKNKTASNDLIYNDYQLYQALNLLKGMSAMNE